MLNTKQNTEHYLSTSFYIDGNPDTNRASIDALFILSDNKPYRITPVGLVGLFEERLSAQAIVCWQRLYELSQLDNGTWSCQLSKRALATKLNKDKANVCRLLGELEKAGCLVIKRTRIQNVYYASKIFIAIPQDIVKKLNLTVPDRKKSTRIKSKQAQRLPQLSSEVVESEHQVIAKQAAPKPAIQAVKKEAGEAKGGGRVSATTYKNTIPRDITNNSGNNVTLIETVVESKKEEEKLTNDLKAKIQVIEQDIETLKKSQPEVKTPSGSKPVGLKEYLKCKSSDLNQARVFLEQIKQKEAIKYQLENEIDCITAKQQARHNNNSLHYLTCSGERPIPEFQAKRLLKEVAQCMPDNPHQRQRINEICYAVRFGELRVCYKTGEAMSIQHALNASLKLLRENRWETPTTMGNKHNEQGVGR